MSRLETHCVVIGSCESFNNLGHAARFIMSNGIVLYNAPSTFNNLGHAARIIMSDGIVLRNAPSTFNYFDSDFLT
jgi:hypothetical protein